MSSILPKLDYSDANRRNKQYHSPEKIEEIRKMYMDGYSIAYIADLLDAGTSTVSRYCLDIERPEKVPLSNAERCELLRAWK